MQIDLYSLIKYLHILAAVVWVGGGFTLMLLGAAAARTKDRADFARIIHHIVYMTPRMFIQVSLAVLVLGVTAAWLSWGFSVLWIDLGFIGWAATFATGLFLLKSRADRITEMLAKGEVTDEAVAVGNELLQISKFDYVVLFAVIADMAFKPTAGDWLLLLIMALAIVAAGFLFLLPAFRPRATA